MVSGNRYVNQIYENSIVLTQPSLATRRCGGFAVVRGSCSITTLTCLIEQTDTEIHVGQWHLDRNGLRFWLWLVSAAASSTAIPGKLSGYVWLTRKDFQNVNQMRRRERPHTRPAITADFTVWSYGV